MLQNLLANFHDKTKKCNIIGQLFLEVYIFT